MSIASSLEALAQAKEDIAAAIVAQGGTVGEGDGFADFATDIATITTGYKTDFQWITKTESSKSISSATSASAVEFTEIVGAFVIRAMTGGSITGSANDNSWAFHRDEQYPDSAYTIAQRGLVVGDTGISYSVLTHSQTGRKYVQFTNTEASAAYKWPAGDYFFILWGN